MLLLRSYVVAGVDKKIGVEIYTPRSWEGQDCLFHHQQDQTKLTANLHLSYRFVLGSSLNHAVSLLPLLAFPTDFAPKLNLISFVSAVAAIAALLVLALDFISIPSSVTASWKSL